HLVYLCLVLSDPAGSLHAPVHYLIRHTPKPDVRGLPEATPGSDVDALVKLQADDRHRPAWSWADCVLGLVYFWSYRPRSHHELVAASHLDAGRRGSVRAGDTWHPGTPPHQPLFGGLEQRQHAQHAALELAVQRGLRHLQHEKR